jgi:REP-associated tyrosine transposase
MDGPGSKALRHGRRSEKGRCYSITFVCERRRRSLTPLRSARVVVRCLRAQDLKCITRTVAFVVMPDHVHWVMRMETDRPLAMVVNWVKQATAFGINGLEDRRGRRVWQRGFYDHQIRDDVDLYFQSAYVLENPMRAGLVESVEQYPHWDTPGWV